MTKKNTRWGTKLDSFLDEEGIKSTARTMAATRVVAWQLSKEMKRQRLTKAAVAERLQTSRAQLDRVLEAKGNVTIESLQRVAELLGRELRVELV
jgi:DNA-binding phage protein